MTEGELWRAYEGREGYQACLGCGDPIRYIPDRFAWVHLFPADHAPVVSHG